MIAALLVALAVVQDPSTQQQQPVVEKIAEVRVHGNATLSDDTVINLAGVTVGGTLDADGLAAIEKRLKDSGRFDEVQVRKRYRTLAMDEVALVLVVHEKPGTSPTGEPPSAMKRMRTRLMFFPIFRYDDGYGFTYGAQTALVDAFGKGTRLSVPLSWGGTRRAAVEADRTFKSGPLTRLTASFGITQRENPFYEIDDRRTEVAGRAERRLFKVATLGADISRTALTFEPAHDDFWSTGADAALDTRGGAAYPVDAIYAGVRWQRLNPLGSTTFAADALDKYRYDARGFKRLFGQNVLALHAEYDTASAPLPPYEQWLLGGSSLRGLSAGALVGDQRLIWSAELRLPFSSPLNSVGRTGFNVFFDGGQVAAHGEKIASAPLFRGVGGGLFITAAILNLNFEVAHSLDGRGTKFHFGTGFSF
jgi:outer membrane protein assembly factor BamA